MRIVLCYPVEPQHIAQIQAAGAEGRGGRCWPGTRVAKELFNCDMFCGHPKVPVDWDGVVANGQLKWIQSSAAGLDHLLVPSVVASDIVVTSASGVLSDQVAEHTIAMVTGLCAVLPTFFRAQQAKEYIRRPTRDLHHATVGIVGFGGVGRRVAELLRAFQTRILPLICIPVDKPPHVAELWPPQRLDDLLAAVDMLILCVPLTEQTRQMINATTLARMKRGAAGEHGTRPDLSWKMIWWRPLESEPLVGGGTGCGRRRATAGIE